MEPPEGPSPEDIRDRAYDLWDRHHRPAGFELEFWLMAERELKQERRAKLDNEAEVVADVEAS